MARETKPTYVIEFPLHTETWQFDRLEKKLNIARMVYNSCLGEALKRHRAVKSDKQYRLLLQNPTTKERNEQLAHIRQSYGFNEYALHQFVKSIQHKFSENIGSLEAQAMASRAFDAVEKLHFGKSKKVHFKSRLDDVSVENKSNLTGLRFTNGYILWGDKATKKNPNPKNWLCLPITPKPKDEYVRLSLMDKTKYVRILKREVRGKVRFFVQLIQDGFPPMKRNRKVSKDVTKRVGLDIGTSTIAIASENMVELRELAPECDMDEKEIRRIQRKMDRSKRKTNPDNFNANGTIKKGRLIWSFSNRYKKLREKRKELYRKNAIKRKVSHEKLANDILALGSDVRVETMRFQSLQKRAKKTSRNKNNGKFNKKKRFGKSIAKRAPAMLLSIIERKLNYQRLKLKKVDTFALKASQFNHTTGEYIKKQLHERWNEIGNLKIQRDLYSAFLIGNSKETLDVVDIQRCNDGWNNFIELHDIEVQRVKQSTSKTLRWFVA